MDRINLFLLVFIVLSAFSFSVDVSNCGEISAAGTYNLIQNLTNDQHAAISGQNEYGYTNCINITAVSVVLDCHGYTIHGDSSVNNGVGIYLSSSITDATLQNCIVTNFSDSGIRSAGASSLTLNATLFSNRYGYADGGSLNTVIDSVAHDGTGMDSAGFATFDGNTYTTFRNTRAYSNTYGYYAIGQDFGITYYNTGNIYNNSSSDLNNYGFYFNNASGITLVNSNSSSDSYTGLHLQNVDNSSISNFIDTAFPLMSNSTIVVINSTNVSFSNINASSSPKAGVSVYDSTNLTFDNLNASFNTLEGLRLVNVNDSTITNSFFDNNTIAGILANFSNGLNISSNSLNFNNESGIYLNYTNTSRVYGNTLVNSSNSTLDGMASIMLYYSDWNNVTSNSVISRTTESTYPYSVYYSNNNTLYLNNASLGFYNYYTRFSGNNTFDNCRSINASVVGFEFTTSDGNTLINSNSSYSGWIGLELVSGSDSNRVNNYTSFHDIRTSGDGISSILVRSSSHNNFLSNLSVGYAVAGGGISVLGSTNTTISDAVVFSNLNFGIGVNGSSNSTKLADIRTYNNSLDLRVNLNTAGTNLNLTRFAFDNPTGTTANVSNISTYLTTSSSDTRFSLNWSSDPSSGSLPSQRTSVSNKYVNLSNNTSVSFSSFVYNYNSEPTDESLLEIWQFSGSSWSEVSSTVSASANTVTISSLSTSGVLGLFQSPSESSSSSSHSSSSSPSYSVSHNAACPNVVTLRQGGSTADDVYVTILQNDAEIASGRTDSSGRFTYDASTEDPVSVRIGSSTFFGPYNPEYCVVTSEVVSEVVAPEPTESSMTETTTPEEITEPQMTDGEDNNQMESSPETTSMPEPTPVEEVSSSTGSSSSNSESASSGSSSTDSSGASATSQNNNGSSFGLLGIGLVLLIILGAGAYWFFARRK